MRKSTESVHHSIHSEKSLMKETSLAGSYQADRIGIILPIERIRVLTNKKNSIRVHEHISALGYYKSGLDMVKTADTYLEEGNLENAYILYLKFITLFSERIRSHPEFNTVPSNTKILNQLKIQEVLPKIKKLKARLLEHYTKEYNQYYKEKSSLKHKKLQGLIPAQRSSFQESVNSIPGNKSAKQVTASLFNDSRNVSHMGSSIFTGTLSTATKFQFLRSVIVPSKLITSFLHSAMKNTLHNIETCGILAGDLEREKLVVTHVIIPQQSGTPDSCTTMNEEQVYNYQDGKNLITIGWIHTHPTQTAFLSSVDLHTHCPYQSLLPEAVAIVCAPEFNQTGIFQLTVPYGLKYIKHCQQSWFHPHPTNPPLFTTAEHVHLDRSAHGTIVDFRQNNNIIQPRECVFS